MERRPKAGLFYVGATIGRPLVQCRLIGNGRAVLAPTMYLLCLYSQEHAGIFRPGKTVADTDVEMRPVKIKGNRDSHVIKRCDFRKGILLPGGGFINDHRARKTLAVNKTQHIKLILI